LKKISEYEKYWEFEYDNNRSTAYREIYSISPMINYGVDIEDYFPSLYAIIEILNKDKIKYGTNPISFNFKCKLYNLILSGSLITLIKVNKDGTVDYKYFGENIKLK
jgi:hypothetical protein